MWISSPPDPSISLHPSASSPSPWKPAPQLPPGRWRGRIQTAVDHNPLQSPLALGTIGGGDRWGPPHPPQAICHPLHPGDLRAWQGRGSSGMGAEGGAPQLPPSPSPRPLPSRILPLADGGRKESLETRNLKRRKFMYQ